MATKPKAGRPTHKQDIISIRTANAERVENAAVSAVASKAKSLSDPRSDVRNTDYWACKPK